MERRDALKGLAALAGATGMSVTPVTAKDTEQCVLILIKLPGHVSQETADRLSQAWTRAVEFTPLDGVKTFVLCDGMDVEFVRR